MTDIAEFLVTKRVGDKGQEDPETRNRSLTVMRSVLISAQNVTVAVGGMMHSGDGIVPGVAEAASAIVSLGIRASSAEKRRMRKSTRSSP